MACRFHRLLAIRIVGVIRVNRTCIFRAVVDEDGCRGDVGVEVVVVAAGDGQVPHPAVAVAGGVSADDGGGGAAARAAELVAAVQLVGLDPAVAGEVEEQVAAGGVDDRGLVLGPDFQVVPVGVMVDQDGGDGLGPCLPGLRIRGQDLVAGSEQADRDRSSASQEDFRAGGEGFAAAGRGCINQIVAVFCGKSALRISSLPSSDPCDEVRRNAS